jgi:hypothetical protein
VTQDLERVGGGAVDTEVAAQSVTGPARHQAEHDFRADEDARDFVHRAVAADGDDEFGTIVDGAPGKFGGVPRALRDLHLRALPLGEGTNLRERAQRATGARIDDEARFQAGKILTPD